jgi:hypothetical protein
MKKIILFAISFVAFIAAYFILTSLQAVAQVPGSDSLPDIPGDPSFLNDTVKYILASLVSLAAVFLKGLIDKINIKK